MDQKPVGSAVDEDRRSAARLLLKIESRRVGSPPLRIDTPADGANRLEPTGLIRLRFESRLWVQTHFYFEAPDLHAPSQVSSVEIGGLNRFVLGYMPPQT